MYLSLAGATLKIICKLLEFIGDPLADGNPIPTLRSKKQQ
jgi:hypothetical protein